MNGKPFKKNPLASKGGFTLVETAVVIAILTILLAAAVKGVIGYYWYGEQKRQNQYAKLIYLAVQSELTQRIQSGWPLEDEMLFTEENRLDEKHGSGIYFLEARGRDPSGTGFEGDYQRYQAGELDENHMEDRRILALYQLLDPYFSDKSIFLEGTIRIELQPWEGLVFRSLYSSHGDFKEWILEGSRNEFNEERAGCFQMNVPAEPIRKAEKPPEIQGIKLYQQSSSQKEALYISWKVLGEDISDWKQLSYDIEIYGGSDPICTILINPEDRFENRFFDGYAGIPKGLSSLGFGKDVQILQAKVCRDSHTDWYCFEISLDEREYRITLLLDTVEKNGEQDEEDGIIGSSSDARSDDGCFFLRKFLLEEADILDFDEISCRIIGYREGGPGTAMKESNPVSYSFSETEEENEAEKQADKGTADEREKP
ncbi:MAG: type II secretion system protein [Lachnospiraceae bacterium]|jgi:prepilin-type N-terminal cleavage/methylation domain-containing protein|nr:type II secretion system protein [Lachnospiraceae bacterium]